MNENAIPVIDRKTPAVAKAIMTVVVYLLLIPLNRVLTLFGKGDLLPALMSRMRPKGGWSKVFEGYEPTEHDVIVSTFAKSGTNWMMQIAHQIAFRGAGDFENIHDVVSWPDMDVRRKRRVSIPLENKIVQELSPTGLRVIKTHLAAHHVPYNDKARYVAVIRDPKEVFVSSWYFVAGVAGPMMPSSDVWFDLFMAGRFPLDFGSSWAEHTASYWALRDKPNVLLLSFREMKKDFHKAVNDVADLMGVRLTPSELAQVMEKSSFAYMKNIDYKFSPTEPDAMPWARGFTMMREGKAGNSKEMLSLEQQARIDAYCQAELERLGSDFPYSRFFDVVTSHREAAVAA